MEGAGEGPGVPKPRTPGDGWVVLGGQRYALEISAETMGGPLLRGVLVEAVSPNESGTALVWIPNVSMAQLVEANGGVELGYEMPSQDNEVPDSIHQQAWAESERAANEAALSAPGTAKTAAHEAYDAAIKRWRDAQPTDGGDP